MSLRFESTPGGDARGAVADRVAEPYSLTLLGFRNDLARHRVLPFLRREVGALPDDLSLPHTLHERIDAAVGAALAGELERLGAMVRLVRLDEGPAAPLAGALPPIESGPLPRFALSARTVRQLAIIAVGVVAILHLLRPRAEVVVPIVTPPPREPRAAAARPEAPRITAASRAQIKRLITDHDLDGAQQALDRILDDGDDAVALGLQGDVHARRGDWQKARAAYERSIALGGEDPDVFLALASIYRQQGMQSAAVDMLHRAQLNGARGADFEQMNQVVVAEQDAESGFGSMTSPHFAVSFDEGEDNATAQLILSQLEDAYLVVGHRLGEYPEHRTPVVLYAAQDFQRVTHSPDWAGALYDGRIKVPVRGLRGDTPDLARTIRHEYAHSLIMTLSGGRCPVWLNEGVAMWAEEERDGDRQEWAEGAVQLHQPYTLSQLESSFVRLSPTEAAAAYAQSYLAVRHLVARYGDRSLRKLLAAFATADTTADAFREALPIELSGFEEDLRRQQGGG